MQNNIEIFRYTPEYKNIWNEFVESSKNGTFLFNRSYMDYHSDRFEDHSFLFYRKGKLYSLLPACIKNNILYSHGGLTYGGLIMNTRCTAEGILNVFKILKHSLKEEAIKKIIYKPIPYIYHSFPSEEDLYALFRNNASLSGRNISSTINLHKPILPKKDRRAAYKKAIRQNVIVSASKDFDAYWNILEYNLKNKYGAKPAHELNEIKKLAYSFPNNIKLWGAFINSEMIAGVIVYLTNTVAHFQYISASPEGKKYGAVDLLITELKNHIIPKNYPEIQWFDLGTSNLNNGYSLNESLIYQKEGFGGRGICYDTYEITL